MCRVAQKSSPPLAAPQRLLVQGDIAPLGDQLADRQAPVRVEVVYDPMVAVHWGDVIDGVAKMGDEVVRWFASCPESTPLLP